MTESAEQFHEEKAVFLEHIQKYGLRRTAQRDLILEVFLRTEEHISSEELYNLVKREDPSIGQTTVYRTLKLLTDAGLAREVRFGDNRTHYEHHYNHAAHDHMVCADCGRVIEFISTELDAIQQDLAEKYNFTVLQHALRIIGLCETCREQAHNSDNAAQMAIAGGQPKVRVTTDGRQKRSHQFETSFWENER